MMQELKQPTKTFGEVCGNLAEPLAAFLQHPQVPAEVRERIYECLEDFYNRDSPAETIGETTKRLLSAFANRSQA